MTLCGIFAGGAAGVGPSGSCAPQCVGGGAGVAATARCGWWTFCAGCGQRDGGHIPGAGDVERGGQHAVAAERSGGAPDVGGVVGAVGVVVDGAGFWLCQQNL